MVTDDLNTGNRSVAQYQYQSISRGKYSVFEQLRKANIPIKDYIGFYSLRNWGKIKRSTPLSNQVARDQFNNIIPPPPPPPPLPPPPPPAGNRYILNKKRAKSRSTSQNKSNEDLLVQQKQQEQLLLQQQQYNDGRWDFLTEQVYIHSKLMIVDDKTVICGSGNSRQREHEKLELMLLSYSKLER
jgi:phosphatidylserine/phosphatidylglycerophosphate/cardiolipin synthase-like enzyme